MAFRRLFRSLSSSSSSSGHGCLEASTSSLDEKSPSQSKQQQQQHEQESESCAPLDTTSEATSVRPTNQDDTNSCNDDKTEVVSNKPWQVHHRRKTRTNSQTSRRRSKRTLSSSSFSSLFFPTSSTQPEPNDQQLQHQQLHSRDDERIISSSCPPSFSLLLSSTRAEREESYKHGLQILAQMGRSTDDAMRRYRGEMMTHDLEVLSGLQKSQSFRQGQHIQMGSHEQDPKNIAGLTSLSLPPTRTRMSSSSFLSVSDAMSSPSPTSTTLDTMVTDETVERQF